MVSAGNATRRKNWVIRNPFNAGSPKGSARAKAMGRAAMLRRSGFELATKRTERGLPCHSCRGARRIFNAHGRDVICKTCQAEVLWQPERS